MTNTQLNMVTVVRAVDKGASTFDDLTKATKLGFYALNRAIKAASDQDLIAFHGGRYGLSFGGWAAKQRAQNALFRSYLPVEIEPFTGSVSMSLADYERLLDGERED